jgi:FtsP/CotA-like multicopper oxidase with cupredoxin domain
VHRELAITLDDILLEDGKVAPFGRSQSSYTAMGRFGNVFLVNGEPDATFDVKRGEVVRFYFTDTANTRVFNVGIPGARVKRVGGDSGRYEREELVDGVVLAPSERAVVDVLFDAPGELVLEHRTPHRTYTLAAITVSDEPAEPGPAAAFRVLRTNGDVAAQRARIERFLEVEPDRTLALVAELDLARSS